MDFPIDRALDARAVLIAGPTASGKSVAALRLAESVARKGRGAVIVNADSMQVYDALQVVTARPGATEEARATHRLYGHVPAETRYSVGAWLRDLSRVLSQAGSGGELPILVGGTGLYFKAVTEGLAAIPDVNPELRRRWSAELAERGPEALHGELRRRDPAGAAAIRPTDPQRVQRALEVLEATGQPLAAWRDRQEAPLLASAEVERLVLEPDRGELYRRIEDRFDRMVDAGALDEVRALLRRVLDPTLPVMKAIGVREFASHLAGELPLAEAIRRAKTETRRYAKRQMTWLRNQMSAWERFQP